MVAHKISQRRLRLKLLNLAQQFGPAGILRFAGDGFAKIHEFKRIPISARNEFCHQRFLRL